MSFKESIASCTKKKNDYKYNVFPFVSNVGHTLLSPYMEESGVGDPSPLLLTKL